MDAERTAGNPPAAGMSLPQSGTSLRSASGATPPIAANMGANGTSVRTEPVPAAIVQPQARFWSLFALQDVLMLGYLGIVWGLLSRATTGAMGGVAVQCLRQVSLSFGLLLVGCLVGRGARDLLPPMARAIVYRVSMAGVLVYNYLMLRNVLPIVRPDSVDATLFAIDLRLFGFEPALWLERFNRPAIIEWFSFFYYSYFWIDLAYMTAVVWVLPPGRITTSFAIGTIIVFCVGQLGYMAVPGFGPISFLADKYQGPVQGGFFWGLVWSAVAAGSAMKDIFPSLHTAVPVWFTLFAIDCARTDKRWRWVAVVTGFFAANIIVSTMLLRWHYAIDVLAGLTLSITTGLLAPRIATWEERRRQQRGLPSPWVFRT